MICPMYAVLLWSSMWVGTFLWQEINKKRAEKAEKQRVQGLVDRKCRDSDHCDLSHQNIWSIEGIRWPSNMVTLDLCDNKIEKLSEETGSAFPNSLRELLLCRNQLIAFNENMYNYISVLRLGGNKGMDLDNMKLPRYLCELDLHDMELSYQDLMKIDWSWIPHLEKLIISKNNVLYCSDMPLLPMPKLINEISLDWRTLESYMDFHADDGFRLGLPRLKTVTIEGIKNREDLRRARQYFATGRRRWYHWGIVVNEKECLPNFD